MTTNKTATKKSWRKPKLTVLVRGKPEEMVLAAGCKRPTTSGGPSGLTNSCVVDNCNQTAGS